MNKENRIRLSNQEVLAICQIFREYFLPEDRLWLFGSRVNPEKKGGDIDLYIETKMDSYDIAIDKKIAFLVKLKKEIGDQKIDVVLRLTSVDYSIPIYEVAKLEGIQLV